MVEKHHRPIRRLSLFFLLTALACNPYLISFVFSGRNLNHETILLIILFEILSFILSLLFFLAPLVPGLKNFTLSFTTISFFIFGFIGMEAGLRIYTNFSPPIHENDKIARDTIFSSNKLFSGSRQKSDKTFLSRTVNTNKYGFRSPPFEKRENNSIRIVALGGSTMWGYNISDDHTIPGFLKERFRKRGPHVEIFNLGLNSSTFSRQTKYLYEYFDKIKPDIIIVYCGVNEFIEGVESSVATVLQQFLNKLDGYHVFKLIFAWADTKSKKPALTAEIKLKIDKAVRLFKEEQKTYEEFCAQKKLSCFIFFQPLIYHKNKKTFHEKMMAGARRYKSRNDAFYDYFVGQALKDSFKEKISTKIRDMRNVFVDEPTPLFTDYAHVNDVGNKLLAERMYKEINEQK